MTRIPALDGLRAIAVLLVILHHGFDLPAGDFQAGPGPAGVRLFFVLSGFLITGILLEARLQAEATGQPKRGVWRAFYIRRALRIFPLAYAVLFVLFLLGAQSVRWAPWSHLFYLQNWVFATATHAELVASESTAHFWSLAIEEQFYLVWPLIALWVPRDTLPVVMIGLMVSACVSRILLGPETPAAYILTPARVDSLAFGAILATRRLPSWPLLLAGLFLLPFSWFAELGWVLLSGVAVQWAAGNPSVLRWRPLLYIGMISYGVYLLHPYVVITLEHVGRWPADPMIATALLTVLSVGAAAVSWHLFEKPLNDLKRYFPYLTRASTTSAQVR